MLIYGQDALVGGWVARQLGIEFQGPYTAIGIQRAGVAVAGVVYNEFMWPNVHVTFVSTTPRWATRQAIASLLAYPFVDLKCRRITATTGSKNQTARSFLCRLGFIQEGFHPDVFPEDDGVSYGLLRDAAMRWIGGIVEGSVSTATNQPVSDGKPPESGERQLGTGH